ncbi:unnamed protein product [Candidula unifasciata]|uniref:Uncharacterized protein n=1 Tax=Candidula unifasciata TaxID=100452 RepID=A0A8S3ZZN2_9EUPU|nr:unnamed protein product [Candidula unifasciata]
MGLLHKSGNVQTRVSNSSYSLPKGSVQLSGSSREYDTARWTFRFEHKEMPNLTFMPIVAVIIFVLCCLLKIYQWSRGRDLWKAGVNVELSEVTEENVSSDGNRDLSASGNPSDGGSCYDTISSFRLIDNGYAIELNQGHPYHDTVTSYKSLLMQKADGSQYDSVQSYKAFLQKVTQNKDLAVEVKLLENYPIRSKSAEHCVVLEEESSERSGELTAKMLGTLPFKKQLHKECRLPQFEKKKPRHRRASGDTPATMRKRSASNPTYRRVADKVGSLPSVRCTMSLSSDSEEDSQQSFTTDRKKLWAERRKISRSASGGKIFKDTNSSGMSNGHCSSGALLNQKRLRHFSADGTRYHKKAAATSRTDSSIYPDLRMTPQTLAPLLKSTRQGHRSPDRQTTRQGHRSPDRQTTRQGDRSPDRQTGESSSENPASSDSSDLDVGSDTVISDSDETKRNTLVSTASEDHTDVFFSLDSATELVSSSEILQSSLEKPLSETKILIARAKEDFFKNKTSYTLMPSTRAVPKMQASDIDNQISGTLTDAISISVGGLQTLKHDSVSSSTESRTFLLSQHGAGLSAGSQSQQGAGLSLGSQSQQGAGLSLGSQSQQGAGLSLGSQSQQGAGLSLGSQSQQGAGLSLGSQSQQGAGLSPGSQSQQGAGLSLGSQSQQGAGLSLGSQSQQGAGLSLGSQSQQGAGLSAGSQSQQGAGLSLGSQSQQGAGLSLGSQSQQGAGLSLGSQSQQGAGLSLGSQSQQGAGLSLGSQSQQGAGLSPGSQSQQGCEPDPQSPDKITLSKSTYSQVAPGVQESTLYQAASDAGDESKNLSSPQKVQRFHVTHVSKDVTSLHSESPLSTESF